MPLLFYALDDVSGMRNLGSLGGEDRYSAKWMNGSSGHLNCNWDGDFDLCVNNDDVPAIEKMLQKAAASFTQLRCVWHLFIAKNLFPAIASLRYLAWQILFLLARG
jgi:hypothetical protein